MKRFGTLSVVGLMLMVGSLVAKEAGDADQLKDIKCPVSGKDINAEACKEFHEGKVYFCCNNCAAAFEKDSDKFATKANYQLFATKQFEQKACPMSGKPVNDEVVAEVGKVKVKLCCEGCQGKVNDADDAGKLELTFSEKAFENGFAKVEKKEEKK
ncbi:MAG: hypothetical protein R3E01_28885 [Pirellulaceae bacterium]